MREVAPTSELRALLAKFNASGGVVDYVFLESEVEEPPEKLHRAAALAGMAVIDRRLERWAMQHSSQQYPFEMFFRVRWDEGQLKGAPVAFSAFWGTDDVEPERIGNEAWSIPSKDGYKTAFFHPPHGLSGSPSEKEAMFVGINKHALGDPQEGAEIFSWSTDWSDYFAAGHEWWGAFFWTIRPADTRQFVVIGASSTD